MEVNGIEIDFDNLESLLLDGPLEELNELSEINIDVPDPWDLDFETFFEDFEEKDDEEEEEEDEDEDEEEEEER